MARPIGLTNDQTQKIITQKEKEAKRKALDDRSQAAWRQVDDMKERLEDEYEMDQSGGVW